MDKVRVTDEGDDTNDGEKVDGVFNWNEDDEGEGYNDHPPIVQENNSGVDAWSSNESGTNNNDALGNESEENTPLSKGSSIYEKKRISYAFYGYGNLV